MTAQTPELREALTRLHIRAGMPSSREVARLAETMSHSTVHQVINKNDLPTWKVLSRIVAALGGDPENFRELWETAKLTERTQRPAPDNPPGVLLSPERTQAMVRAAAFALARCGLNAHDCPQLAQAAVQAAVTELLFPGSQST